MAKRRALKKKADKKKVAKKSSPPKKQSATSGAASGAARLFELSDGRSDKFWEVAVAGNSHTVRFGRVGTDGQSKTKSFANAEAAENDAEKLISQKTKKGYREIKEQATARSVQAVKSKQEWKEHEPFLTAIINHPDNFDPYGIYSDWLSERGDPRGEFIQIQWELEDASLKGEKRKKLATREKQLLRKNREQWLGDLAEPLTQKPDESRYWRLRGKPYLFSFARGFLDSLQIDTLDPDFARQLAMSPVASMLRKLHIVYSPNEWELEDDERYAGRTWRSDSPSIDAITRGRFANLRELFIGEGEYGCHIRTPNIHKLVKNCPRLELLTLQSHDVTPKSLFRTEMPSLRSIALYHGFQCPLEVLAKNSSLQNLESISVFPHCHEFEDDEAYITFKDLKAICRSDQLPSLKHIHLRCTDFGDQGIREIVNSGILQRLESLKLTSGAATDNSIEVLQQADLGALKILDLSENYFSADGVKQLKKLKTKVVAESQFQGDPGDEDDREHLWQGDIE